jgi:hypothetical protein
MYHPVLKVLEREGLATGSDVALLEPVRLLNTVLTGHQHVATDVEFTFVV